MNRKHIISITYIFIFALSFTVVSAFAQTTRSRAKASIRGENYSYKLYDEDFVNTPNWDIEDGEPPVSISRAIQIAKLNLARFVEVSDKFKTRSIQLRKFGNSDKWYYSIRFVCRGVECRGVKIRTFRMLVKMNESVVEPKMLPPDF